MPVLGLAGSRKGVRSSSLLVVITRGWRAERELCQLDFPSAAHGCFFLCVCVDMLACLVVWVSTEGVWVSVVVCQYRAEARKRVRAGREAYVNAYTDVVAAYLGCCAQGHCSVLHGSMCQRLAVALAACTELVCVALV